MAKRSWKVRMGRIVTVVNTRRKFGANKKYALVKVQDEQGREGYLLFTRHQLKVAQDRARKNPEDVMLSARLIDAID